MAVNLDNSSSDATRVASPFVALHVAAHAKCLPAASVGTPEWLLACVAVRVDPERRRTRESLVACSADIPVLVLLVGSCSGRREVVVVLPGGSNWRNDLRRNLGWCGDWSLVVDCRLGDLDGRVRDA